MGLIVASKILTARKTLTLTGGAALGVKDTAVPVFTVTGEVFVHALIAFCTTNLTEGGATATISLGTVSQVTRFIGLMNSVDLDANEAWVSTTPTAGSIDLPDAMQAVIVVNGDDIIVDPLTQDTTGGVIDFTCFWEPISTDGVLVRA